MHMNSHFYEVLLGHAGASALPVASTEIPSGDTEKLRGRAE